MRKMMVGTLLIMSLVMYGCKADGENPVKEGEEVELEISEIYDCSYEKNNLENTEFPYGDVDRFTWWKKIKKSEVRDLESEMSLEFPDWDSSNHDLLISFGRKIVSFYKNQPPAGDAFAVVIFSDTYDGEIMYFYTVEKVKVKDSRFYCNAYVITDDGKEFMGVNASDLINYENDHMD